MRSRPWLLLAPLVLLACHKERPRPELLVFAAASTTDALQPLGEAFAKQTGVSVRFSFASSSTLARQLEAGAPADLFLSADQAQLDQAKKAGAIAESRPLLTNALVVVGAKDQKPLEDGCALAAFPKVSLADPTSVPAGVYAKRWLTTLGCWEKVAPHVVPALDVRAALAQVESGAVPVGVVYSTDAAIAPSLKILFTVSPHQAPAVVYPLALTTRGARSEDARALYQFLASPDALRAFAEKGFGSTER
jgi:molybdate transport system substrate-binding protein